MLCVVGHRGGEREGLGKLAHRYSNLSRFEWFEEFLLKFLRSKGVNSSKEDLMRNYRNLGEGLGNIVPRESN